MRRLTSPSRRAAAVTPAGPTSRLLPRLTALRAFAALVVFLFHLHWHDIASLPFGVSAIGGTGVAFFFVLSGFVLAWGTAPDLPARTFYRRRFARVYPSDFVTLLIAVVVPLVPGDRSVAAAVANALTVQAWSFRDEIAYGMNGVSWSLSCEAFFYAVFPLAALVVRRLPRSLSWSLAVVGLLLATAAYLIRPGVADHYPLVRISEFLLGLVAGIAVRDGWRPRIRGPVAWGVLLAGLAAAVVVTARLGAPVTNALVAGPFLVLILYMADRDITGAPGWLRSRALVFAGEVSFAFYLVHELVIVNLIPFLPDHGLLQVTVMSAVAVAAAVALHLLVERPCNRWLRDRAPSLALADPPVRPAG
ncbi:acyltransferase family protein [Geodermatophilus sp. SYSU D00684]